MATSLPTRNIPTQQMMGEILVSQQWVTPSQLGDAIAEHQRTNERLGEVLVRQGHLTHMELEFILAQQKGNTITGDADNVKLRLGDILRKSQRLSSRALGSAVAEQRRTNEKLGEVLLRLGLLDPLELDAVLSLQSDFNQGDPMAVRLLLGEILIASKRLSRKQLADALENQRLSKKQIGQVLVDLGFVNKLDIRNALKIQAKMVAAGLVAMMSVASMTGCAAPNVPTTSLALQNVKYEQVNKRVRQAGFDSTKGTYKVASLPGGRQLLSFSDGSRLVKDVPFFKQGRDNTCAQAAQTVVLNYWGIKQDYQALVRQQNRMNTATHYDKIVENLKSNGLQVKAMRGGNLGYLKSLIDQGKPPIVLLEFNNDLFQNHYITVVGYNNMTGKIIFHDSIDGPFQQLDEEEFELMWQSKKLANLPVFGGGNFQGLIIEAEKPGT
ncbi:MAG: C39 family peptidase [Candidatus Sericytochromatia bacterium]|nr:C39 family peptidase [Candidatus Sericytochromatia bacterium]